MTDLGELVDAYEHTVRAVLWLARESTEDDAARPTECPGWTVLDQVSHVIGIERSLLGHPEPDQPLPPGLDHVRNAFGERVERDVELRRGRSLAEVSVELADVLVSRLTMLRAAGTDPDEQVPTPLGGRMTLRDLLALRTFDIWAHEQDVRRALGRPGNLGSSAAVVAVDWLRRTLPRVVARGAGLPVGAVAVIEVTGPVAFTDAVAVREGPDGRPVGEPVEDPGDAATVRLTLDTEAFTRRSTGRWAPEDTPVHVTGDQDAAHALLAALAVTP